MNQVLILGGYGNFGARIAAELVKANISVVIAGRHLQKAQALRNQLIQNVDNKLVNVAAFDAKEELDNQLDKLKPIVVINTIGPFQAMDDSIAKTCIIYGVHYLDLADARDFVTGIISLNDLAKQHNVLVVSGASTVPGLSSAVLDHYQNEFSTIDSMIYGISPGQKAPRGLATTQSILTYLGKPLKSSAADKKIRYGWQDIYRQDFPELGKRWMANCDIPDLDLFPEKYGMKSIQFSAGMENYFLHFGMWLMSWIVRLGVPVDLSKHAGFLLRASHLFDRFGTSDGGMFMMIKGKDNKGDFKEVKWFMIAKNGDGPQIPCIPAIILAKKLVNRDLHVRGAMPCLSMMSLEEYMNELREFSIKCIAS